MQVIMDGLLFAATVFAGTYCWVLARRVRALGDLDKGLGGAITTMNRQIEQARTTLTEARGSSKESRDELKRLIGEAEDVAHQLRALIAALNGPKRSATAGTGARRTRPGEAKPVRKAAADLGWTAPAEPARKATGDGDSDPDVPKPRRAVRFDDLLRPSLAPTSAEPPQSEAEILEALAAIAGGGR